MLADRPLFFMWSADEFGCDHAAINWRQLTGGMVALKIPLVASVCMSEKSGIQSFRQCFHNGTSWLLPSQNTDSPGGAVDARQYLIKAGAPLSIGNSGCFKDVAYNYEIFICDMCALN
jgi:hypothetical protein